ncbi:MAG: RagB/SusD family nutrient uptake outer membrane protein [Mangrovibacterium sp.]
MKNIYIAILALLILNVFSACSEWLDVDPQGQIEQEDMFNKESGFEDALNGVYIEMKDSKAYGEQLSVNAIEYLVSSWDVEVETRAERIGLFNYGSEDVKTLMESIFQQQYFIITEANAILTVIDDKKSVFQTEGMYEQVKGECLAIRAYVHFDLLRLFGPIPSEATDDLVLPYVTSVSKDRHAYSTFLEFKEALAKDIDEARNLLKTAEENDVYTAYTPIRMNAEAINALDARVKLWFGNKSEAFQLAQDIISSTSKTLGTAANFQVGDYNIISEQFVGLHVFDMYDFYTSNFSEQVLYKGNSSTLVNTQLYGNTGTDIRENSLWTSFTQNDYITYSIKKYSVSSSEPANLGVDYRRIPLLRLSEMYFIAVETAPDLATAQTYWDAFRQSRNLEVMALPEVEADLKNELAAEYRREFFAEGQAFYAYKRLNVDEDHFLWLPSSATINYVVPLPELEVASK